MLFAAAACGDRTTPLEPRNARDVRSDAGQGGAPAPIDEVFVLNDPCSFPVQVQLVGKEKITVQPNGLLAISSPGATALLMNLESGKSISEGITGTIRVEFRDNGDAVLGLTGRSLVETENGLFLTIGNFSITVDVLGNSAVPLAGVGRLLDVCALLN